MCVCVCVSKQGSPVLKPVVIVSASCHQTVPATCWQPQGPMDRQFVGYVCSESRPLCN